MYLILSIVTGIYLILSSVRDLKERMIYTFPAIVLALAWGIHSVELYENEYGFLLGAWIATVVLWFLFRRFSMYASVSYSAISHICSKQSFGADPDWSCACQPDRSKGEKGKGAQSK